MIFCSLTKYNDNPPPIRLYTNSIFYWLMRGFHRTFATGVACWKGTLTPPDTWSRPIWDLHMVYLLRRILFSNLSLFFRTMHFKCPSILYRFCLVATSRGENYYWRDHADTRSYFVKHVHSDSQIATKLMPYLTNDVHGKFWLWQFGN